MARKPIVILPIATALASLAGIPAVTNDAGAKAPDQKGDQSTSEANRAVSDAVPNLLFNAGEDLLGLIVTTQSDGTIIAQHGSHASHSSHSSHHSHYSGR